MFKKCCQRLRHQACVVLFGIVLISACTVSAGAVVLEKSGDGFSLFGGVIAPSLPSVSDYSSPNYALGFYPGTFFDPSLNPLEHYFVRLLVSDSSFSYDSSSGELLIEDSDYHEFIFFSSFEVASFFQSPYISDWTFIDSTFGSTSVSLSWSSFDVYGSYGLVYSYVPPYSLDGMDLILWDGDISGLSSPSSNKYLISSFIPVPDYAVGALAKSSSDSSYIPSSYYFNNLQSSSTSWSLSTDQGSVYFESDSTGLYFYSYTPIFGSNSTFSSVLAYPSSDSPLIDFTSTTLTASNPQYDYQSAEFDVSWSNLPVIPYPDNIQYFIQGRLNDGAAAQPPEIYLGSSSDPPTSDVPVSFSFTNLQPETQYTATFELVYNTTGSFRDFIGSGVTTTVSFTTLSDGSISEGDKAIINAIQNANKDNQQWTDSQFGSAVGDLPQDTTETDNLISGLDQQEEAYKDEAYDRFQELSTAFSGFDGSVGSGIGLAGTLFTRFYRALGSYQIIYTFPLLLGLAMVLIGRLGRSSIRIEREPGDQFKIDGW